MKGKQRISLGNLRELLEKGRTVNYSASPKSRFNVIVARAIRRAHIAPERLAKILAARPDTKNYTPQSLENCAATSHLWNNLPISVRDKIKTAFIYGSTARGAASLFPHYIEDRHYRQGRFIKSRFTRAPAELQESDVDFAIVSPHSEEIKDAISEAMTATHRAYPNVKLTVKLFPEDKLLNHIRTGKTCVPRGILVFSDHIPLTGQRYLDSLKKLAFKHSKLRQTLVNVDFRSELDMRVYKKIGLVLHNAGLEEFELPAREFSRVLPFEYQIRAHEIDYGSPKGYVIKLELPKLPGLRRRVEV